MVAMVAWGVYALDYSSFEVVANSLPIQVVVLSLGLFRLNALILVGWMLALLGKMVRTSDTLEVVGWHMLSATVLPARAGDLAWTYLMASRN